MISSQAQGERGLATEAKAWDHTLVIAGHSVTEQGPETENAKSLSVGEGRSPEESKHVLTAARVPTQVPILMPKMTF